MKVRRPEEIKWCTNREQEGCPQTTIYKSKFWDTLSDLYAVGLRKDVTTDYINVM